MLQAVKPVRLLSYTLNAGIGFRTRSFKVLDGKLDIKEPVLQHGLEISKAASIALRAVMGMAKAGGGSKAIHKHTVTNKKLLVRHRLKLLFDEDSPFVEIGLLAGMSMDYGNIPAAGGVSGIGKIRNHYCIVCANDATVKGGTVFPISVEKQIRLQQLALLNELPCIYLVDSGGAFLPLQADIFPDRDHGGRTFYNEAVLSANGIPQIAVVCGNCTAGGAYCPMMAEETIIVKETGIIYLGGPPLVKAATGEVVSEQDLGGADLHCRISGCTDYYAETEEEAFEMCRESILTLNLPENLSEKSFIEPLFPPEDLEALAGKKIIEKTDMYKILSRILDNSMFKEFKQNFGQHIITGFGYICGKLIGLIANCSSLTCQDAQKCAHFIQLCDKRKISLVFLQNSGYKENVDYWSEGREDGKHLQGIGFLLSRHTSDPLLGNIFKDRAKMICAHCSSKVPKIVINIGGCFGDDNFTMCGWSFQPNFLFSWPLAHTSLLNNFERKKDCVEENYFQNVNESKSYDKLFENTESAFFRSSRMLQDGIILPQDTRQTLALCLDIATSITSHSSNAKERSLGVLRM